MRVNTADPSLVWDDMIGLWDQLPVIWSGKCQFYLNQTDHLLQSYLDPASSSTCGPLVVNHPQWGIAPRRHPKLDPEMVECRSVTWPTHWACVKLAMGWGRSRKKSPSCTMWDLNARPPDLLLAALTTGLRRFVNSCPFKPSRCINASFYIPENRLNSPMTRGFRKEISMKLFYNFL